MTRRFRLSRRWLVVIAALGAVLVSAHRPLLTSVGRLLIVDQPRGPCAAVLIISGDGRYDAAAEVYRRTGSPMLLLKSPTTRLVQYGILPPGHELARHELRERGVPDDAIVVLPEVAREEWKPYQSLDGWMTKQPEAHVLVLADRYGSRNLRYVLDRTLGSQASRVSIRALADRRYDETNWWQSRKGIKSTCTAYLALLYAWINGPPTTFYEDTWDPDHYEKQLLERTRLRS